jgi:hypothetical protein
MKSEMKFTQLNLTLLFLLLNSAGVDAHNAVALDIPSANRASDSFSVVTKKSLDEQAQIPFNILYAQSLNLSSPQTTKSSSPSISNAAAAKSDPVLRNANYKLRGRVSHFLTCPFPFLPSKGFPQRFISG